MVKNKDAELNNPCLKVYTLNMLRTFLFEMKHMLIYGIQRIATRSKR